ncbi:MAG: DoxX family protein [Desulfobacterales bacterium]
MLFSSQERRISFGLLIMRIGLAAVLLIHSLPRLFGGAAQWKGFGTYINHLNIGIPAEILGLVISIIETLAGLSLLTGYLFRISCTCMIVICGLYFINFYKMDYRTLTLFSLGLGAVYTGLFNTGPGRYAVSVKLEQK